MEKWSKSIGVPTLLLLVPTVQGGIISKMMINGQVPFVPYKWAGAQMWLIVSTCIVKKRGLLYNGVGFSHCINKTNYGKGTK